MGQSSTLQEENVVFFRLKVTVKLGKPIPVMNNKSRSELKTVNKQHYPQTSSSLL